MFFGCISVSAAVYKREINNCYRQLKEFRKWTSKGEKHWHGGTATTAMTHIAIAEQLDGKAADWMEKVSDEQYQGRIQGRQS